MFLNFHERSAAVLVLTGDVTFDIDCIKFFLAGERLHKIFFGGRQKGKEDKIGQRHTWDMGRCVDRECRRG